MKIGNIELKHGIMLAPMAGVSDASFRYICREYGAEYTVSEMVSAKAIYYKDQKTARLSRLSQKELPVGIQIFGSDPEIMAYAAQALSCGEIPGREQREWISPSVIDINMGCPVPKIVKNGDGSALMKNPVLAGRIIEKVKNAVKCPVTVKIRAGWDHRSINAVEMAVIAEASGADAICVHARTREQMYDLFPDWSIIRKVKKAVAIPVIGNGGIQIAEDALRMYETTGCDGVMVARGAEGNPWIFSEIRALLEGKNKPYFNQKERIQTAKRQLAMMLEEKGEHIGLNEARHHMSWYIRNYPGSAAFRCRINAADSAEVMYAILDDIQQACE